MTIMMCNFTILYVLQENRIRTCKINYDNIFDRQTQTNSNNFNISIRPASLSLQASPTTCL